MSPHRQEDQGAHAILGEQGGRRGWQAPQEVAKVQWIQEVTANTTAPKAPLITTASISFYITGRACGSSPPLHATHEPRRPALLPLAQPARRQPPTLRRLPAKLLAAVGQRLLRPEPGDDVDGDRRADGNDCGAHTATHDALFGGLQQGE